MAPFQVPKNFKFKLFFSNELNVTLYSLPMLHLMYKRLLVVL
jgi:hypothetical protein